MQDDPGTRLIVSLTSGEPPLPEQIAAARAAGADLVELRADLVADEAAIASVLKSARDVPLILTVRARDEGGAWDGDDAERIAMIERLGLLMPGYVDVEYATWTRSANLRQKIGLVCGADSNDSAAARPRNALVLSRHDTKTTPADLDAVLDPLSRTRARVLKVVFAAEDARDALRVLDLLRRRAAERPLVALATGPAGLITRVLARKFGAFGAYAALSAGAEAAPGQPTATQLRQTYHWDAIGRATRVHGVIGWPVAHSGSPQFHNAAMTAAGIDGVYLPLALVPTYPAFCEFMDFVSSAAWLDAGGFSVTLPHKEHALRWLTERDQRASELARRCGAVNTLTRAADGWTGENTDIAGVMASLDALRGNRGETRGSAAVLGAGGAARAVVVALLERGWGVTLYNRTPQRAAQLASEFGCQWLPWAARLEAKADLLVNCTSVGQSPAFDESPLPAAALRPEMAVFDTIYNPAVTRLLEEAQARGCQTIGGKTLFEHQAAAQFALWHGSSSSTA